MGRAAVYGSVHRVYVGWSSDSSDKQTYTDRGLRPSHDFACVCARVRRSLKHDDAYRTFVDVYVPLLGAAHGCRSAGTCRPSCTTRRSSFSRLSPRPVVPSAGRGGPHRCLRGIEGSGVRRARPSERGKRQRRLVRAAPGYVGALVAHLCFVFLFGSVRAAELCWVRSLSWLATPVPSWVTVERLTSVVPAFW